MERSIESTQRIESKRKKISYLISIFIVISLCLLVGAKFTGWYEFQTGHGEEVTYSSGAVYGLDSLTVYYDLSNDNYHDPTPYDDLSEYALSQDTFFTNLVFLLMDINSVWFPALVLSIVSIFVFLATLKRGFSIYPSVIINLVAGLAVLTMPLMLNLMIPQGYDYSFMGSSTEHIVETYYTFEKWGPGAGFFISLISGSLLVVSAITMARFHYLWGSVHPKVFLQKRAKPIIISLTTILVAVILIFSYYNIMDLDGDGYVTKDDLFPNNPLEWEDLDKDGVGDNFDDFFAGYPSELVKY